MDPHTLELLEFQKIRSLLAGYAACALGRLAALDIEPGTDLARIREQHALTSEMVEALSAGLNPPFGGLLDIRERTRRARTGASLIAEELAEVADALRAIHELGGWLNRVGEQFPRLGGLKAAVGSFNGLSNAIGSCLDERGRVVDSASRRLAELRLDIARHEERIQATLREMIRSSDIRRILRYPGFTLVGHHYVLPVAREQRGELQGSVHRTSASNETVYIEPQAIADQSAQLSYLRAKEQKEVRRILRWLSALLGQDADALLETLEALAHLDLIYARARFSRACDMTAPEMRESGGLVLRAARHPLLEHLFRERSQRDPTAADEAVVPIDLHLGQQASILVVTGPNTGGKTVALKTVGLLAVMAQSGLHIPAGAGSCLPVFDTILADIGDEQSIEQSLSTFSAHVRRMVEILSHATERSLVLLDEIGAGTDPVEGAALGRSILDELDGKGCLAIVTTHIGALKTYALENPRAANAAVEFDLETLRPLYRLRIGDIGQSNALEIARRLNLPEHLIERARTYLESTRGVETADFELARAMRREAEAMHAAALDERAEAQRLREALERKLADLHAQSEHDTRLADARARLQPGDRVVVPRFGYDRPGRVVKIDVRRQTALVAIGKMQWDVAIDELIPQVVKTLPVSGASPKTARTPRIDDFESA